MKLAVVINTCALKANTTQQYSQRADFIRNIILPRLVDDPVVSTICIVGEFETDSHEPPRYTYVPVSNTYGNCRDVLAQRQAGWEKVRKTQPDAVLFLMDDHVPSTGSLQLLAASLVSDQWEVLSPNRRSMALKTPLNTGGWNGAGTPDPMGQYLHTHGIVLTPRALSACPWIGLTPIYRFDVLHTMWFVDKGLKIVCGANIFLDDILE